MANWQEEGWKEAPLPVWNLLNYAVLQNGVTEWPCLPKGCANLK